MGCFSLARKYSRIDHPKYNPEPARLAPECQAVYFSNGRHYGVAKKAFFEIHGALWDRSNIGNNPEKKEGKEASRFHMSRAVYGSLNQAVTSRYL